MLGAALIRMLNTEYHTMSVSRTLKSTDAAESFNVDICDRSAVRDMVTRTKPDVIVHCAALTNVDICEKNYEMALSVNADSAAYLAESAAPDIKFVYISTDSVFDGAMGMYSEDDKPNPINNYAMSKLEGERQVRKSAGDYLILRSNIIGHRHTREDSLAEWVARSLRSGIPINMFTDVIFAPLDIMTYAGFIMRLIRSGLTGCLHLGARDGVSKYDLGCRIARRLGLDPALITPKSIDEERFTARRPKNTTLDVSRAEKMLGPMPYIDEELDKWCKEDKIWIAVG